MVKAARLWKDDRLPISKLSLDLKNPRIPDFARKNEGSVLNYLLESEDVLDIAENISKNGYHRSATLIVVVDSGKTIVLDGNRRLAACKLLLNPKLAKKETFKKRLDKLSSSAEVSALKLLKVSIAPTREAAEKEIWDIHMNVLHKPWQVIQKNRKYRSLIQEKGNTIELISKSFDVGRSTMYKDLTKLAFYERILEKLRNEKDQELLLKTGLNKIERIIYPQHGKDFLGYELEEKKGELQIADLAKFDRNLAAITPYILSSEPINGFALGAQCKADDVKEVLAHLDPTFGGVKVKKTKKVKPTITAGADPVHVPIEIVRDIKVIRRRNSEKYKTQQATEIVEHILCEFDAVVERLKTRRTGRNKFLVTDEYDVQDLLHPLLSLFFEDVINEDWDSSHGLSPSRSDFLLLDNGTIIETKSTQTMTGNVRKRLETQLSEDIIKYSKNPQCKQLYFFVYDPEKKINKPELFERGINSTKMQGVTIKLIINRG